MRLVKLTISDTHIVYSKAAGFNLDDFTRWYWTPRSVEEVDGCGYDEGCGWSGHARCGNPKPCGKHADLKCWCGKKARTGCSAAGSLVCGSPVCKNHPNCRWHSS